LRFRTSLRALTCAVFSALMHSGNPMFISHCPLFDRRLGSNKMRPGSAGR
jgi:hypothetical protein